MNKKNSFMDWIGVSHTPDFTKARPLGIAIGILGLLLALATLIPSLIGLIKALNAYAFGTHEDSPSEAIRNIGLFLVAAIAFPLTVYRLVLLAKQNQHDANVLFNEKLHQANVDLHAQRQITVPVLDGEGNETHQRETIWEDDIIRRNGAIDRLGELAVEAIEMGKDEAVPRIARLLCVYLKEMTREFPAEQPPNTKPTRRNKHDLETWAQSLKIKRSDMESAAKVLGRLSARTGLPSKTIQLDLSDVNLQGMELVLLDFSNADFRRSFLDGTQLYASKFDRSRLQACSLIGSGLVQAKFCKTHITETTDFSCALTITTQLRDLNLEENRSAKDLTRKAFGDGSVILPDKISHPSWWPDTVLDDETFDYEWELFNEDPSAYVPPQDRDKT